MDQITLLHLLLEREERTRRVIEQLPGFVWTTDGELEIVTAGGGASFAPALAPSALVGCDIDELASEVVLFDPAEHRRALAGEHVEYQVGFEGRDYLVTLEPFHGSEQTVEGVIGMALDQTERRVAEDALRESEGRFRALIENSSDGIVILEEDLTIRYASPSIELMLGWRVDEMVGRKPVDFWHPDEAHDLYVRVSTAAESPGTTDLSAHRLRARDGSWRLVETTWVNLFDDPLIHGFVSTLRDVTEQRALEERLRVSERLEAIGQLAGGIAHDFNNVLLVIRGYTNVLRAELDGTPHLADLEEIEKAAERATNLTRQLLAFGRRQLLRPQLLAAADIVCELETLLRSAISERIELEIELDGDAPWVLVDPSQLEQILLNLVVNSRDAMEEGGRISVRVRSVVLEAGDSSVTPPLAPGAYTAIAVEDDGGGIAPEVLPHVFEPFFTTKAEGIGTGLGLPTVYGAVAQAGGSVGIRTAAGEGTTVTVYLPAAEGVRAPGSDDGFASRTGSPVGSERVLLVEDEPAVRVLVERVLKDVGYAVHTAALPNEALAALAAGERFDLLLTDVVMPEMSGYELASKIGAEYPEIRVLFMSGYSHDAAKEAPELGGKVTLLSKPFAPDQLAVAVRSALDSEVAA